MIRTSKNNLIGIVYPHKKWGGVLNVVIKFTSHWARKF